MIKNSTSTWRPRARRLGVMSLSAVCAAGWAAPPMSVEAQALAHWVYYTRLNVNRLYTEEPFVVVDSEQLRWWLFDAKGRWSVHGPVLAVPPALEPSERRLLPVRLAGESAVRRSD